MLHLRIGGRGATGQRGAFEDSMQIGRHFFQAEIIIAMAVCTTHFVEVLPFCLLLGKLRSAVAAGDEQDEEDRNDSLNRH